MKGFIKILEAIIASIILLTSLTFFFNTQLKESNWGDVLLKIRSEDVLATLIKSGTVQQYVNNNDVVGINNAMLDTNLEMMPITVDYSIQIKGIPNPVIYIGCNCTQSEMNTLQSLLDTVDFAYKDRNISMRLAFDSIDSIRNETNALVIFGYKNMNPYSQKLSRFLEKDGTIVVIGDLTQAQINDGYLNTTFGLLWMPGVRSNTGNFLNSNNETRFSFKIEKYYKNLTGLSSGFQFTGSATIGIDERTVVSDGVFSLVKVNSEIINGHGRAVWMADPVNNPATSNMTKAVFMWASGESFRMDQIQKKPAKRNFKSSATAFDKDSYEIILTVWKIFQ